MDPTGPTAMRFPLLARPRPSCVPLKQRVADLTQRARAADHASDLVAASSVFNLAALLASDVGLPDLARHWCHRQAALYLRARPLQQTAARHALEPLVNLARLHIREGRGEEAFALLEDLFTAVATRSDTVVDGLHLPTATLIDSSQVHREVRRWLWGALLADGARALATAGRWSDAYRRLRRYNGIGNRMLDGRQVAVMAHATAKDPDGAMALLESTHAGEPWENAVTACLTALCGDSARHDAQHIATLLECYKHVESAGGLDVFHTRLGLSFLDAIADADDSTTRIIAADLIHRVGTNRDGYAARDLLAHERCAEFLTDSQARNLNEVVHACALGHRAFPAQLQAQLEDALDTSEEVLVRTLDRSLGAGPN